MRRFGDDKRQDERPGDLEAHVLVCQPVQMKGRSRLPVIALGLLMACTVSDDSQRAGGDPLPSWSEGSTKDAITSFVAEVSDPNSANFVQAEERIAVFDNDGTLWAERPFYFQLAFALDRLQALAPEHPEWQNTQPFKAALEDDLEAVLAGGKHALLEIVMASHAGMTTVEFEQIVRDWVATARHPDTDLPYTEMLYQPMLELLTYLRANDFKTYIVSGGGIEFLRAWAEQAYGIPPEQMVGSSIEVAFEVGESGPILVRKPELDFIDDKAGKPVGIHKYIGRRPILAFGNSDGDFEMLQYTAAGGGSRLMLLLHHDDADREWAYDRDSHVGRLDRGLDEAAERGWIVVSMKDDFGVVFGGR